MQENRLTAIALGISLGMHISIIGASGGFWNLRNEQTLQTQAIVIQDKKTLPLPEIKIMGEFKQFKKSVGSKAKPEKSKDNTFAQPVDKAEEYNLQTEDIAEKAMLRYQDMVKQRIESHRNYPLRAQRMRLEGIVDLAFVIARDGSVRNIRILQPSGSKLLDNEAVNTINKASPFNPLPEEILKTSVDIRVAIVFSLQ